MEKVDRVGEPNTRRRKDRRGPNSPPEKTLEVNSEDQVDEGASTTTRSQVDTTVQSDHQAEGIKTLRKEPSGRSHGFY